MYCKRLFKRSILNYNLSNYFVITVLAQAAECREKERNKGMVARDRDRHTQRENESTSQQKTEVKQKEENVKRRILTKSLNGVHFINQKHHSGTIKKSCVSNNACISTEQQVEPNDER